MSFGGCKSPNLAETDNRMTAVTNGMGRHSFDCSSTILDLTGHSLSVCPLSSAGHPDSANGHTTTQPKTKNASFKLTPEQHKMIDQRAKQCGVRMSVWMRLILLQAASRQASEGYLRIREPNGDTI